MRKILYSFVVMAALPAAPVFAQETPAFQAPDSTSASPAASPPAPSVGTLYDFFPGISAAPGDLVAGMFPAPPAGKAQIVFYRSGGMGTAINCTVHEHKGATQQDLSKLTGNRYFIHVTEPGRHTYWVSNGTEDDQAMTVTADKTYLVRCQISAGGAWMGQPAINQSTLSEFEQHKAKLKPMAQDDNQASGH